ncbi:Hypothetical predicted protein, partial [Pelobates cultripes]
MPPPGHLGQRKDRARSMPHATWSRTLQIQCSPETTSKSRKLITSAQSCDSTDKVIPGERYLLLSH